MAPPLGPLLLSCHTGGLSMLLTAYHIAASASLLELDMDETARLHYPPFDLVSPTKSAGDDAKNPQAGV